MLGMTSAVSELTVRADSVQRIYGMYLADRFRVNRRYQRKLVWSVDEKRQLIDSMLKDLPVPLFLVAETEQDSAPIYELIDGMQRLNAIFSFLENEFDLDGTFFDLDTLAETKLLKDKGVLEQKQPAMDREKSAAVAYYQIALSVYRSDSNERIDEVFRRINSGGRRLSRQELRQAGTISPLADLVRTISSMIRGDTSPHDILPLRVMPQLSVTNYDLFHYGVDVENIFWVKEGILRREDIRESLDEQLVLDLVIDCLVEPLPSSGTTVRDDYYNYSTENESVSTAASVAVTQRIDAYGIELIREHFMRVYDEIRLVGQHYDKRLATILGAGSAGRAPRYFHALFIAFFELIYKERLHINDRATTARALQGIGKSTMNIPGGGGDWRRDAKRTTIDAVKGVIRPTLEGPLDDSEDLGKFGWQSHLETVLTNARVEQQLVECKQGFMSLGSKRVADASLVAKIAKTLTAMANAGPDKTGYVVVGVADSETDAQRIEQRDDITSVVYRNFKIVGVDREARISGKDLNEYWQWILQRVCNELPKELSPIVKSESKFIDYHGHCVILLKVKSRAEPTFYKGELLDRTGPETVTVSQENFTSIYSRFLRK